jgi:CheY-like chemotaxis protein
LCESVERIRGVAIRASEIVRELMMYAGNETAVLEAVDLSGLVREMLELLSVSIARRGRLKLELPDNLPAIRGNATQIRQVVLNLVSNASEALGDKGGTIAVSTSLFRLPCENPPGYAANLPPGVYVRLEVGDTGCGMSPEILSRIFDPFFTTKFAGRGLGLAAVQGIVRSHAGAVDVASAPGEGTRVGVMLPCAGAVAEPAARLRAPRGKVGAPEMTVLLVEDEDALRMPVAKLLRKQGFFVIEAGDGVEGVQLFQSNHDRIDVVLLDMTLPGMSGREVFHELRKLRPDVRIVLTTAYSRETVTSNVGPEQDWVFIRKPYELQDLITVLRADRTDSDHLQSLQSSAN